MGSQLGVWTGYLPMHGERQFSRTLNPFPAQSLIPSPWALLMLPPPPPPVFSLTSSVTHITPCCRWGGSLALGIHTAYVCVSRQWKQLLTEDEAVSPSFFDQGAVSQTLKLNIFSPFTNGMKQIP